MREGSLLKGFLNASSDEASLNKHQLIRILSRSSTIPKLSKIQVQYVHSQPEMFLIDPGKQLRLGVSLLDKPILALVALRYGFEWQIWHEVIDKIDQDCRVADIAASLVAARFISLLPKEDQIELEGYFPEDLIDLYLLIKNSGNERIDYTEFNVVNKHHELTSPERPIDPKWLDLIEELAIPTELLMVSGGDVRLNIEKERLLNVYGCRPFPRPEAYTFASSTATSISNIAYDSVQRQREFLIQNSYDKGIDNTYSQLTNELRRRLRKVLKIQDSIDLILAPSGTDISLLFAGICLAVQKKNIIHILVASDESGSGVPLALSGRHFANTSALGKKTNKGELINGFGDSGIVNISLRNEYGLVKNRDEVDNEIYQTILKTFSDSNHPVLHVMDQSKLGYMAPSQNCLNKLVQEFGGELTVIVDNSQLRMSRDHMDEYIEKGCWMTITGSKYFTGPPFSGALIVSNREKKILINALRNLPEGFKDYFFKSDFTRSLSISNNLSEGHNLGSYLRWFAALVEIERYYEIPIALRSLGSEMFCEHVGSSILNRHYLELLQNGELNGDIPSPMETRTIFPFFVISNKKALNHEETKRVYHFLNQDLTEIVLFEQEAEKRTAKQVCHIGQPVKAIHSSCYDSAVVRISLGSRVLSENWKDHDVSLFFQGIESQMNQVDLILNKIELILKYSKKLSLLDE